VQRKTPFNDLARAARAQSDDLVRIAAEVVDSGWFVHGKHHRAFEEQFAAYLGTGHVIGVGSGTDALEIALRAVRREGRNTVVTVANAGGYTTCAALAAGLEVRYVDIDEQTHTMSPQHLAEVVDDTVAAVVVTHLYGRLADVTAALAVCRPLGIAVIEDCAQAHGARDVAGRLAGSFGDLATFSFYPTKNLGAIGDGGAIATSDDDLAARARRLAQYGWASKYTAETPGGRNSRLDELQAAFLSYRLPKLDGANARRREIIATYATASSPAVRVLPAERPAHTGHLSVVVTRDRARLRQHLTDRGIATDIHYPIPDHRQDAWRQDATVLPVTESVVDHILSVPCFPELTDDEVARVADALASYTEVD